MREKLGKQTSIKFLGSHTQYIIFFSKMRVLFLEQELSIYQYYSTSNIPTVFLFFYI